MFWDDPGNQARMEFMHTAAGVSHEPNGFTLVEGGLRVKAKGPQ